MFMDASYYHAYGPYQAVAGLKITGLRRAQDYCLAFYYYMFGSDIYQLTVTNSIAADPVFSVTDGRCRS